VVDAVLRAKLATLHELDTVYSLEDLWTMFEINAVAQYNEHMAMKRANKGR